MPGLSDDDGKTNPGKATPRSGAEVRFDSAAAEGRWNPLDEIRKGTEFEMADVSKLVNLLVDPVGEGLKTHWQWSSQGLLVGVILHTLYGRRAQAVAPKLTEIRGLMSDAERSIGELWDEMLTFDHFDKPDPAGVGPNRRTHPWVAKAARDMKDRPYREAGAVLSTAKRHLSLFG